MPLFLCAGVLRRGNEIKLRTAYTHTISKSLAENDFRRELQRMDAPAFDVIIVGIQEIDAGTVIAAANEDRL